MKHVYVVTHGSKFPGPNPGMTEEGFKQVRALRPLLPDEVGDVVCGTGLRHLDVAKALDLTPTRYTAAVGGPESGEVNKAGVVDEVLLADGTKVPYSVYTTPTDGTKGMEAVICSLRPDSVVCAGRPSMVMLGMAEGDTKSAAVYRLTIKADTITRTKMLSASGESEINPV